MKPEAQNPKKEKKNAFSFLTEYQGKVPILDVIFSLRHLATMLNSSLALEDALKTVRNQSDNPKLKKTWDSILGDIQVGQNLSSSMTKSPDVFPSVAISVVRAGEQGGTLEKNLKYLADYLKKDYELKRKIKGALFYPAVVIGITVIEMLGVIFFILPRLDELFKSFKNVPETTKWILAFAQAMNDYKIHIGIGILVFVIFSYIFLKTKAGQIATDKFMLWFPVIKIITQYGILANFSRTLSILLESSIPIGKALEIAAESMDNSQFRNVLAKITEQVKGGKTIASCMIQYPKFFPPTFVKMVEVGEETGTLEENLMYLHEFYADDVQDMSNNLATLIEPILLVFIGIMIGLLAMSIVFPIYQLSSSIN